MPTLTINGRDVDVDEGFLALAPEQQHAAIEHMAKTIGAQADVPWSGSVLPISGEREGDWRFDSNAGVLGALKRAVTAPGDVATGKIPVRGAEGYNEEFLSGARDLAGLAAGGMTSPASIAPRMVPKDFVPPTARALKSEGSEGYNSLRASGFEMDPAAISDFGLRVQNELTRKGFGSDVAPGAHSLLGKIINPPREPGSRTLSTIDDILALRENLGGISTTPKDQTAGGIAKRALDEFLGSVDPAHIVAGTTSPQELAGTLKSAAGNWAASERSNTLAGGTSRANTSVLGKAEGRTEASSGNNLVGRIRGGVESLLERPKDVGGFSDAEIAALEAVRRGGLVSNTARHVGDRLGAGSALQAVLASMGAGGVGVSGGSLGTAIATGLAPVAVGSGARSLANVLAKRSLNQADETVRLNSPLARELARQQPLITPSLERDPLWFAR